MAELLVRVMDKINADPYKDCRCTKRGDVIVARPDGWTWGKEERAAPFWRIVRVLDLSLDEAEALTAEEPQKSREPNPMRQRRQFFIDLAAFPVDDQTKYVGPRRDAQYDADVATVRAAKTERPPREDPAKIGDTPADVIG